MKKPLLRVKKLSKYYPAQKRHLFSKKEPLNVLKDVSFQLNEGEILGLVGESGCGKSTLALCISQLLRPYQGEVFFEDSPLHSLKGKALRQQRLNMQMVFQDPYSSLNPRKTILESIGYPLIYHKMVANAQEQKFLVEKALIEVGLSKEAFHLYPHQFSGGQQQRISIARALVLQPKLIICDEAVSALDLSVQAQILNLLAMLHESRKLSYLFISHDLGVVRHFCDRIIVLHKGQIVENELCHKLFTSPQHAYTQELIASSHL